jgi:hypothetical protein
MERITVPSGQREKLNLKRSDINAVNLALSLAEQGTGNLFPPYDNYHYILNGSLTGISLFSVWRDQTPVRASFLTWSEEGLDLLRPAVTKVYQRMVGPIRTESQTEMLEMELPRTLPQLVSISCIDDAQQTLEERKFIAEFEQTMAWAILVDRKGLDTQAPRGSLELDSVAAPDICAA